MDKFLISPGPDFKWHVAKHLDRRIRDFEALVDLEGREVLLPSAAVQLNPQQIPEGSGLTKSTNDFLRQLLQSPTSRR